MREATVRRGQWLSWVTLGCTSLEAILAVGAALLAGSVALLGFGIDSFIEVAASLTALWRLRVDRDLVGRAEADRRASRIIGFLFLALAVYVAFDGATALWHHAKPDESLLGMGVAVGSLIVMPVLAHKKRKVAAELASEALTGEARQTEICAYLAILLLVGLVLNAVLGWWWADPVAALVMVPLIGWEGIEGLSGRSTCKDCLPQSL